jgi:ABC-type nitrate/sulfonate/bicarbonate transport system substrate-binding protein
MGRFRVRSTLGLQEWVAEQKGYFRDEGLDYEFIEQEPRGTTARARSAICRIARFRR